MAAHRYVELCAAFLRATAGLSGAAARSEWDRLEGLLAERAGIMAAVERLGVDLARLVPTDRQEALRLLTAAQVCDRQAAAAIQQSLADTRTEMAEVYRVRDFMATYMQTALPQGAARFLDTRR